MMQTIQKLTNLMRDMAHCDQAEDINMNFLERHIALFKDHLESLDVIHPASRNGFNAWWDDHEPFCCKSIDDEKNLAADAYNAGFNVVLKLKAFVTKEIERLEAGLNPEFPIVHDKNVGSITGLTAVFLEINNLLQSE